MGRAPHARVDAPPGGSGLSRGPRVSAPAEALLDEEEPLPGAEPGIAWQIGGQEGTDEEFGEEDEDGDGRAGGRTPTGRPKGRPKGKAKPKAKGKAKAKATVKAKAEAGPPRYNEGPAESSASRRGGGEHCEADAPDRGGDAQLHGALQRDNGH